MKIVNILANNYNRNFSFGNNRGTEENIVKPEVVNPLSSKRVVEINTARLPELMEGYPCRDINKIGRPYMIYKYTDGVKIFVYADGHYINLAHDSTTKKAFTLTADDILPQEKIEGGEFVDIFGIKETKFKEDPYVSLLKSYCIACGYTPIIKKCSGRINLDKYM